MEDSNPQNLLEAELRPLSSSAAILRLAGEIDISSVDVLTEQFKIAASARFSEIVIDATNVTFMDSTGVHAMIEGKRLLHQAGSAIALVPSLQVRRVLELISPEPVFAARVDTLEEALSFLGLEETQGGDSETQKPRPGQRKRVEG